MKVLIACEESQAVTKAFRANGHDAYSSDIQDCSGGYPEWHIKGDVFDIINDGFDLMIAHPPCTYISNSGVCHLHKNKSRWGKLDDACEFFKKLLESDIKRICIENPIPHKYGVERIGSKYNQIIHPYMFGHMERKSTCLWLKNLPKLQETNNVKDEMIKLPKNIQQRLHYLPPGPDRAKQRSKTFSGIAKAFADQWGVL